MTTHDGSRKLNFHDKQINDSKEGNTPGGKHKTYKLLLVSYWQLQDALLRMRSALTL